MNLLDYIGSGDNHFMRLNVSCLLTDFSYFETFWSEFKPENGQLAQNKADSKLTPAVSHPAQYYICIKFTLYLYLNVILPLHSICIVGKLTPPAVSRPVVTISRLNFGHQFLPNNAVTVFLVLQIQIHKQFYEYHLLDANYLANLIIIVVTILGRLLRDVKVSAN